MVGWMTMHLGAQQELKYEVLDLWHEEKEARRASFCFSPAPFVAPLSRLRRTPYPSVAYGDSSPSSRQGNVRKYLSKPNTLPYMPAAPLRKNLFFKNIFASCYGFFRFIGSGEPKLKNRP